MRRFVTAKPNYFITVVITVVITSLFFVIFICPSEREQIIERAKGIAEAVQILKESIPSDSELLQSKLMDDVANNR